jgi:hypothetical protein
MVPVVADALTLVVVDPSVTEQVEELGAAGVVLFVHAATANATDDNTPRTITKRESLISRSF